MSNDILKKAALAALEKELEQIPSEHQLSLQYSFSEEFTKKMETVIYEHRSRFITVFGKVYSRRLISYFRYAAVTVLTLRLYVKNTIGVHTARMVWLSLITATAIIFRNGSGDKSYDSEYSKGFEKKFTPAFMDVLQDQDYTGYPHEPDYILPNIPVGFTLKEEYRTASKHIASFSDLYGNTVHYVRNSLKEIIDYVDADTVKITEIKVNGLDAIEYFINGENHIMWEDRFFQYHFFGKVDSATLHLFTDN